ncbi:MAG: hypothetical protein NTW26_01010 [bacterium]|nr:hypothetical protein [bacterium]
MHNMKERPSTQEILNSLEELIKLHYGKNADGPEASRVREHLTKLILENKDNVPTYEEFFNTIKAKDKWHGREKESRLIIAEEYAAKCVTDIDKDTRKRMKEIICKSIQDEWGCRKLESELYHNFKSLQRDWRRIALTETARISNYSYLLRVGPGNYVTCPQVAGACDWCASKLEHKVFLIVSNPMVDDRIEDKYAEQAVWIGKSNVGRHRCLTKEGTKRKRDYHKLWWPCCPGHPHCRHVFIKHNLMYGPPGPRLPMSEAELAASPNKPAWLIGINTEQAEYNESRRNQKD